LQNWAKTKVIQDRLSGEVSIPCPNYQCKQSLEIKDLIDFIGIHQFEKINVMFTDMYLSHAEDIRRCPNEKCNYAGTIELKVCHRPLNCPECDYKWREYTQMSKYQKCVKSVKELINFNSETFSYMKEVLTGTPCPR
jgi:hypothetical protein